MAKTVVNEQTTPTINIIAAGTVIVGDIKANGDIRIDGQLNGKLHAKGRVVIGNSGHLEGEIYCQNADISGIIKGTVHVNEMLSMKSTAKITGDIFAQKLSIEQGASFTGNCNMQTSHIKEAINHPVNGEGQKRTP